MLWLVLEQNVWEDSWLIARVNKGKRLKKRSLWKTGRLGDKTWSDVWVVVMEETTQSEALYCSEGEKVLGCSWSTSSRWTYLKCCTRITQQQDQRYWGFDTSVGRRWNWMLFQPSITIFLKLVGNLFPSLWNEPDLFQPASVYQKFTITSINSFQSLLGRTPLGCLASASLK